MKKFLVVTVALIAVIAGVGWLTVGQDYMAAKKPMTQEAIQAEFALQDESKVPLPEFQPGAATQYNPLKNLYWGELHIHTEESFDARLMGTKLSIEDAYRFAKGEKLTGPGGEPLQLFRPIDFVAITDHAETFGMKRRCERGGLSLSENLICGVMLQPNPAVFMMLRQFISADQQTEASAAPAGVYQPRANTMNVPGRPPACQQEGYKSTACKEDASADWQRYIDLADKYYEPGVLTTFVAYEYSPVLPNRGKHHRNIIFNGSDLPPFAISSSDVSNAVDLWRDLDAMCQGDCDFLTIPHNMNKGWGLFYSRHTWDGIEYGTEAWKLRQKREPLAEMYQVKGASECALGVGATDEECAFGQVLEPCTQGQVTGCAFETSFARQGLKIGLQLDQELGFNPLQFGMIAATDGHTSNPGDVEEMDFRGKTGAASSPAIRRITEGRSGNQGHKYHQVLYAHEAGGLAAVWAEENTRDAIFGAMKRREAYATSGPRIALRFFAGWGFDEGVTGDQNPVAVASAGGVPMGAVLYPTRADISESPTFFVWAGADPLSAPLKSIQMVKGWVDADGNTHEQVQDIVCSDGLTVDPATNRCPDNGAKVNLENCHVSSGVGAQELKVAWRDPTYDPKQGAFYYARVLENPTCRWPVYDAKRLGRELPADVPKIHNERAWSSPIWIDAKN